MKQHIKSVAALFVICVMVAVLMAATNSLTAPIIAKNDAAKANEALTIVMPNGTGFESVDISAYTLPATVTEVYKETAGNGYVVKLVTSGYGSGLTIMVGVDNSGVVTGATCVDKGGETLGAEQNYGEKMPNQTIDTIDSVEIVSGATKTTTAYKNAVKDAINTVTIMGGGSVDIRSEEEILLDNLKSALPDGEEFSKVFLTEVLEGVDAVYTEANGKGWVYVIGESFYGMDAVGNLITEADDATKTAIADAHTLWTASSLTEVDITGLELPKNVLKVSVTPTGNYVLEIRAEGYGIKGHWQNSGKYIFISVAATPRGKIISTVTTAQSETEGYGDPCADESYYSQFDGKDATNYTEVDAIAGASEFTSKGYVEAIGKVFEAIEILEGGAE